MNFGSTSKALVLLIREHTAELLSWQQRQLSELALLDTSAEDQEIFTTLIRSYKNFPVIIVADLLDESFRHDTVVHVKGSDHAALMARKLNFAFRNTPYRRAIVTGRHSEGRKDDRIMLSALTKPEHIDLWANLLLKERMAIQSISSMAHLLNLYVPLEKLQTEEYLLLSLLDSERFLRQTFIAKGKVMFSRQASLNQVPDRLLGQEILQESVQLRQYLERIHFVPYTETLKVQILATISDATLQVEALSRNSHQFEVIDVSAQAMSAGIHVDEGRMEPAHYLLARVLEHTSIDNVYAPPALQRFSDLRKFGRLLLSTAAAVAVLGVGMNIPSMLELSTQRSQTDNLRARTLPLQRDFRSLVDSLPAASVPPREMRLMVDTYEVLSAHDFKPLNELNLISSALARSPGLLLTKIEWSLQERPFVAETDTYGGTTQAPTPLPGLAARNALSGAILHQRIRIMLRIEGETYSPTSYRDAQEQVLTFADALAAYPGVEVLARQMPINTRTDASVSTTINDSEVRSGFSLELHVDRDNVDRGDAEALTP